MDTTLKICAIVLAGTALAYVVSSMLQIKKRESFFAYGMRYGISRRLLDIFDAPELSDSQKAFDMTPKQRFDQFVITRRQNAIKSPRLFNFGKLKAQHAVSQSLINDFYFAARLALIAYQTDPNAISHFLSQLGVELLGTINDGNVYVYVAKYGTTTILCIQGTEFTPGDHNIYEVWSDLSITPRFVGPYADMYVHSGFYDDVDNLYPQIATLLGSSNNVWIIGHSLGAVRAMLIRSLLPETINVRITTFGCPRGASQQFFNQSVNIANTKIEQVVADRDFAYDFQPLLPYYHATPYFYWLTNDNIYYTKERDWINLSFSDHSIVDSYIARLAKLST